MKSFKADVSCVSPSSERITLTFRPDEGLTLETSSDGQKRWPSYVINSVDNTKLPRYTHPLTQHHIFFRNLAPCYAVWCATSRVFFLESNQLYKYFRLVQRLCTLLWALMSNNSWKVTFHQLSELFLKTFSLFWRIANNKDLFTRSTLRLHGEIRLQKQHCVSNGELLLYSPAPLKSFPTLWCIHKGGSSLTL